MNKNRLFVGAIVALAFVFFFTWSYLPVEDRHTYFHFADARMFFYVPNTMDVLSNLGFLFVGVWSLYLYSQKNKSPNIYLLKYKVFLAIGSILTCFGSMYFHWNPNPATLVWDRLPMTLAFSSIAAMVLAERIDEKLAARVFVFLVPIGFFTVLGFGWSLITLRPYIVMQFGTILVVALALLIFKSRKISNAQWAWALGFYVLAKVLELNDHLFFDLTGNLLSGHSLKHLAATVTVYKILK